MGKNLCGHSWGGDLTGQSHEFMVARRSRCQGEGRCVKERLSGKGFEMYRFYLCHSRFFLEI